MFTIHKKPDGVWLEFHTGEGKLSGMLNLNEAFNRTDGIAARAMREAVDAMEMGYKEELNFKLTEPQLPTVKAGTAPQPIPAFAQPVPAVPMSKQVEVTPVRPVANVAPCPVNFGGAPTETRPEWVDETTWGDKVNETMSPKKVESSGGPVSYYLVQVSNPNQGNERYQAECGDIIEALGMNFNEGCAFKALWRSAAARTLNVHKKGGDTKYDAEKVIFYGKRILSTLIGGKV
jgi:hypothetical protein